MRLSAPVYRLKRQAKLLARQKAIPLHEALDRLAVEEGFQSWSHLASARSKPSLAATILPQLDPGDMILLGARPGHGKTLLGLELVALAATRGRTGFFFTLDFHERDVATRFSDLGVDLSSDESAVIVDTSDEVSADHIVDRLKEFDGQAVVVIDYLQLLDQKRTNPSLDRQINALRTQVKENGTVCVVISQIDRSFDLSGRSMPGMSDIRLPNPLKLSAFDKFCFMNNGEFRMAAAE